MKKYIYTLLLAISICSCCSDDDPEIEDIAYDLISKGNLYGAGEEGIVQQNLVIKDQSSWDSLVAKMDAINTVSDSFLITDIDFSEFFVIAVFEEVLSTGGYEIDLKIKSESGIITVYTTNEPSDEVATLVITQPYSIVLISITDLPIMFEELALII